MTSGDQRDHHHLTGTKGVDRRSNASPTRWKEGNRGCGRPAEDEDGREDIMCRWAARSSGETTQSIPGISKINSYHDDVQMVRWLLNA